MRLKITPRPALALRATPALPRPLWESLLTDPNVGLTRESRALR